jgi:hypothetical protein
MPIATILLVDPVDGGCLVSLHAEKQDDIKNMVATVLDVRHSLAEVPLTKLDGKSTEKWGVMIGTRDPADSEKFNVAAGKLLEQFGDAEEMVPFLGRVAIIGFDEEEEALASLKMDVGKKIRRMVRASVQKPTVKDKLKRALRPFDAFSRHIRAQLAAEIEEHNKHCKPGEERTKPEFKVLNQQVYDAWHRLKIPTKQEKGETSEAFAARVAYFEKNKAAILAERRVFDEEAAKDKERYLEDKANYDKIHLTPPKPPQSPYQLFLKACKQNGLDHSKWNTMTEEQKQPFVEASTEDKYERFFSETSKYKEYCEANGLDFHEMTKKKPKRTVRKRPKDETPEPARAPQPKKAKKAAPAAKKPHKPMKVVDAKELKFDDSDSD